MGLLSRLFGKKPENKGPRKRMCIQCGSILPEHVHWCPIGTELEARAKKPEAS